jgi:hypothetical protein
MSLSSSLFSVVDVLKNNGIMMCDFRLKLLSMSEKKCELIRQLSKILTITRAIEQAHVHPSVNANNHVFLR